MGASIEQIKKIRNLTGAGVNAIREALKETDGIEEKALAYLRKKGMAKANKRKDNSTSFGVIGTYIHSNNQLVVTVEVNTETDFAARGEDLKKFANDMALQVAAANARFLNVEGIDEKSLKEQKETFMKDLEGKPDNVKENIVEGKLQKFYKESVLMKQDLFVDDSKTVEDYLSELVAKVGEKIVIKRFIKSKVSEDPMIRKN